MEEGNTTLMAAVMLGWSVVVPVVFLRFGKRAGALTAVVVGNLIMPWVTLRVVPGIPVWFAPQEAIALALVTGMLTKEGMAVFRGRPRWFDLPILVYSAYPLVGLVTAGRAAGWDVADITLHRVTGWLIPYAAARRYLGDVGGSRQVAVAIVVATLAYVPVCAWEAVMGPRWYLGGLIYGHQYKATMVERLGGWRPEGFFMSGIFLASWVAIVSAVALWLWLGRSWRPSRGPAWWPSLALVATTVGCRGVYGYIELFFGLTAALLTIRLKTRWFLVGLALVAPLYVASRVSGVWDGRVLVRVAGAVGRPGTVEARISQEDEVLKRVFARAPAFGAGRYPTFGIDGGWDLSLYQGGLVGLTLHLVVLELYPLALLLARPGRAEAVSPAWALMLFLTLTAIDGLHNKPHFTPEALALGSLVGLATAPAGATARRRGPARTGSGAAAAEGGARVGPAAVWPRCAARLRRLMARDLSDAPTGPPGSLPRHFYSLDVLRGLAALAIVFWHWSAFYDGGPESPPFAMERQPLYVLFWPLYSYGGTAVDLFFCLSGFIFYWLYGPGVSRGAVPAREFAVLRFSRLYPLHLLTLGLVAVGQATYRARHGWFFLYEFNDPYHFVLQLLFASSWGFERGFSFDGPVWSVSVEVMLYFAFFVACRLGLRRWWHLALLVVAGHLVRVGVHSSLGRGIFCFFIGGLCFYAVERLHRKGLARTALPWLVAALGVAIPVLPWLTNYCRRAAAGESPTGRPTSLGGYLVALGAGHLRFLSTAAVIFPLLVMTLALIETRRGTLGKRLSFLGHVSYSTYLLHFPLQLGFVLAGSSLAAGSAFYDSPAALVVFFGTLIPLSLSSYWFFERPSQSFLRARLIPPRRRPVAAGPPPGAGHRAARLAVAIALLAVPELLGLVTGHPPSRSRSVREKDQGEAGPVPGSPDRPPPAEASGGRPDDDLLRRVRDYLEKDEAAGGYREKGGVRP